MKSAFGQILLLTLVLVTSSHQTAPCDPSWDSYIDEKCLLIITNQTYSAPEAIKLCTTHEANLVTIHNAKEQVFTTNLLFSKHKLVDAVWLGANYDPGSTRYKWIDGGGDLEYSNWASGSPTRKVDKSCVQMAAEEATRGQWTDEPCAKRNVVVCEKIQAWSLAKLQKTLLQTRQELVKVKASETKLKDELDLLKVSTAQDMAQLRTSSVPVGLIYIQLPKETSPRVLWPHFKWADISNTYAGVFFRVLGETTEPFGAVQTESCPHLQQVHVTAKPSAAADNGTIVPGTWSGQFFLQYYPKETRPSLDRTVMSFYVSGDEVRPRNMAVKVWKRVG